MEILNFVLFVGVFYAAFFGIPCVCEKFGK